MNEDAALLRRYVEENSDAAFTELVRRHVDLVYHAALRRTGGDPHRAADVAQQVFTTLAREARKLAQHAVLCAWLHTATRNAALNLVISENRRRERERAALELETAHACAVPEWERVRPVLDAAIDELPEPDRAAVVLRFLERHSFAEIGTALRVSEDAARMRTDRALDRLRGALARRGITSTAAALGALVAGQPLVSAPVGLAATIAAQALAHSGAALGAAGAGLALLMNAKLLTLSAATLVAVFAGGLYAGLRSHSQQPLAPIEVPQHAQKIAALRQENGTLRAEVDRLNAANKTLANERAAALARAATAPAADPAAVALTKSDTQKRVLNNLRQLAAAADQFQLENGRLPTSIAELVGATKYVKRIVPVSGEDYAGLLFTNPVLSVVTDTGETVSYGWRGRPVDAKPREVSPEMARVLEMAKRLEPAGKKAMEAYRAANGGQKMPSPEALIPYFATPQEGADYVELIEAEKAARRSAGK